LSDPTFDLVVIGGGPGGYVAAIRAAQLGLRTACVEKRPLMGGTCLNVGCIPSKALLNSSEKFAEARDHLQEHGVLAAEVKLDLAAMQARKRKIVADLGKGIGFLLEKNGIRALTGAGRIAAPGRVVVTDAQGAETTLETANILIATGSETTPLSGVEIDEERIVSSTGALAFEHVPERLVVIGAGVIGLELGSVWSRLGAQVEVVEFLDRILPGMDGEIAKQTQRALTKQGLAFRMGHKVTEARADDSGVTLSIEPAAGGASQEVRADRVLVAIGRRAYTEGLGLDPIGVATDERGVIGVDGRFQTSIPGILAVGDCVPGPRLAHKAEDEGILCAEMLAGQAGHIDHDKVPAVVYTSPEVAGVGRTEEQLKEAGIEYRVGKFPFSANSRARITGQTTGLVKLLSDAASDRVLGVHILGPLAGDLLAEAVLALEYGATAEDIARTCHSHPATGEAVKEAALASLGRALHL
jgi:dihydrolipoamide dehydrogenase